MAQRRPIGALEAQVLEALWARGAAATPGDVLQALDGKLAYTTVMTVLTRLWQKGHVTRSKVGRAYAYAARQTRDEFFADKMRLTLASSSDHRAVLSRFVGGLSARDVAALRSLLKDVKK
jgi:predicted transcriptional regulator